MRRYRGLLAGCVAFACLAVTGPAEADDGSPGDGSDPFCSCRPRVSRRRVRHRGRWDIAYPAGHWKFWWYADRATLLGVTHRAS